MNRDRDKKLFKAIIPAFLDVSPEGIGHDKHGVPPDLSDRPVDHTGWATGIMMGCCLF